MIILSYIPSAFPGERSELAALKIKKGELPAYLLLSWQEEPLNVKDKLKDMLQDALVFTDKLPDLSLFIHDLGIEPATIKEVQLIDVRELITIFYPTYACSGLEDIAAENGFRRNRKTFSRAQRQVRMLWDIICLCWDKGLKSDAGYLSKLKELTRKLTCYPFIRLLEKEVIRNYPDRPIFTGQYQPNQSFSLFEENLTAPEEAIPAGERWVEACFEAGGLLASNLPGYEDRQMQRVMARAIIEGFTSSRNLIIEAGTGTGKSAAYLLPALWWAKSKGKKVVVATHTITLQEQLNNKDLPFLSKVLPFRFKTAILKGKSNYLCLRNFFYDQLTEDLGAEESLAYAAILSWIRDTTTGDITELPYLGTGSRFWRKYSADNGDCWPADCRFARDCFLLKAKKKAEEADLLIINHALLFADIKTNHNLLPEFAYLVIDEAHNIYSTALKQLGFEISLEQVSRMLENINGGRGCLVNMLKKNLPALTQIFPAANWTEFQDLLEESGPNCVEAMEYAKTVFRLLDSLLIGKTGLRLSPDKLGLNSFETLWVALENLVGKLRVISGILGKLTAFLAFDLEQLDKLRYEILKCNADLSRVIEGLNNIMSSAPAASATAAAVPEAADKVTYAEKSNTLYLKHTAVDIAAILNENIFERNQCTVLTSATLTIAGSFDYFAQEIGLTCYQGIQLDSPFDYEKQMQFCIVNDLPVYSSADASVPVKAAALMARIAAEMNGRTLILFTSHHYLRLIYGLLQQNLNGSGLRILAQGIDGGREFLLQEFMKNERSVLLGASSFWEGVDIPGERLSCVIITKLPFSPPDSPIFEAKTRLYESRGRDPFYDLHLPEAVIRFKQGFGRLIRSKEDRGMVILLDDRVIKKHYGRYFLKSLPLPTHLRGSAERIAEVVKRWRLH